MFNKKHIITIAALSLSAVMLAGCQENAEPIDIISPNAAPAPAAAPLTNEIAAVSSVTESKAAEPMATFNLLCELPESAPSQLATLRTKPFWFEAGLPEKVLLDGVDCTHEETRKNEYFPEIDWPIYINNTDRLLLMGYNGNQGGDFYFNLPDGHKYGTLRSTFDCYNMESVFDDKELDGFSPEEAVSRANEMLDKLGITHYGTPEVWAIKADKANAYLETQEYHDKQDNVQEWTRWTEDDEVYYLTYPVEFNGIPVALRGSYSGNMTHYDFDESVEGAYIEVTVTRDGIDEINTYPIPAADAETIGTVDINVSAQQALELLTQAYSEADFPYAMNVTGCRLEYAMTSTEMDIESCEHTLIPAWSFEMYYMDDWSTKGQEYGVYATAFVDASTGRVWCEA
ncbi:MAG: hypothetical protein NC299_03335 [Lachnospiraceae bacterium]|nr:hypothetical protein [Ruminococcus sp.]MCM1274382.1 hypothetical protein [Lachnospiraceae bacterium]